jgi:hypothetical protein
MPPSHDEKPKRALTAAKPGASAQAFYEEQRKAWIHRNRRVFRILDGITAAVIISSLIIWQLWTPSAWYAGLIAGMALCFDLVARLNPPTWIEHWQSGAFGEARTGRELTKLDDRWLVIHDLQRSNGTNIDHVVVGPAGVFLLDSKNIATEVSIDGDDLVAFRPDGKPRYRDRTCASKARGAAAALSQSLTVAGAGCWVHAVIVVWGDMPEPHVPARSLDWVAGSGLVAWLNSRPAERHAERIARAKTALTDRQLNL